VTPSLHDEIAGDAKDPELGYLDDGYLEIFRTAGGGVAAEHEASFARGQGFTALQLGGDELREREPALSASVLGGFHYPEARSLDPYAFVLAVADDARSHGARLVEGVGVEAVVTEAGRARGVRTPEGVVDASAVILATGAYSPHLYRALGCPLPVTPAKGYHVDRPLDDPGTPALDTACLLVETSVFCTPMPGRLRLAGTLEFSGINDRLRRRRLDQLTRGARPFLEELREGPTSSEWCGLRPCTPDGLPVVGPLPGWGGVYAATGHAMLGLTFGPVTGEIVADLVIDGEASMPVRGMDPGRF
jgi:D-amino-acid dehydrogenase